MATVRPCVAGDIEDVAALFMRVFRGTDEPAPASMRSYFADLYLGNPWVDPGRPPVVAIDGDDRVVGFIGALPMPLRMRGRKLDGVIGGSFMVDRELADPLAAVQVLRRFLGGSQDIAMTDTANPVAIRFWERLDGHVAHFQSMRWLVALRPAALGVALADRDRSRPLARAIAPAAKLVDRVAARRVRPSAPAAVLRESSVAAVFDVLEALADDGQLGFGGTLAEFEWLVEMMRRRTHFGPLHLLTVHRNSANPVGAVLYFPNRRGVGQLVVATAAQSHHGAVLHAVLRHAYDMGSVGLMGHADARLAIEMRHLPCAYLYRNDFTVLHSREPSLVDPLCAGDVAMTRLTGEWWTRMQGDIFD